MDGIGFIQQSDGDFAGIESIYVKSDQYHLALIKVGSGITSGTFDLSPRRAQIGDTLSLVGYGVVNNYSSKSTLSVVGHPAHVDLVDHDNSVHRYYDVLKSTPVLPDKYMPTSGDSGAAVWIGNSLYGIHSGSNSGKDGLQGIDAYHANSSSHISWIKEIMSTKSDSSLAEKFRAFRGGIAQKYPRYNGGSDYSSSSVSSSSR